MNRKPILLFLLLALPFTTLARYGGITKMTAWERAHIPHAFLLAFAIIGLSVFYMYRRHRIALQKKKSYVEDVLPKSAESDALWQEEGLKQFVRSTFLKIQEVWRKEDLSLVADLVTDKLHSALANSLARKANKNVLGMGNIQIDVLDIVGIEDRKDDDQDRFTAYIRGTMDTKERIAESFEEIYQFMRHENKWYLYNIKSYMDYEWILDLKTIKE